MHKNVIYSRKQDIKGITCDLMTFTRKVTYILELNIANHTPKHSLTRQMQF